MSKVLIYPEIPVKLSQNNPSHLGLVKKLMDKMKLGEMAVIKKKDWKVKTDPASTYQNSIMYKHGIEYTFSQKRDKENFYLLKVKYPISYKDKKGNSRVRNDWVDKKVTFKITRVEQ